MPKDNFCAKCGASLSGADSELSVHFEAALTPQVEAKRHEESQPVYSLTGQVIGYQERKKPALKPVVIGGIILTVSAAVIVGTDTGRDWVDMRLHYIIRPIKLPHDHDGSPTMTAGAWAEREATRSETARGECAAAVFPARQLNAEGEAYPFEVVRSGHAYKGRTLRLKVAEVPWLMYGKLQVAGPPMPAAGQVAMQLERELSPGLVLFDVKGVDVLKSRGGATVVLGQMIVAEPIGQPELDVTRNWIVTCLGVERATNQLGGPVEVVKVRFERYADEQDRTNGSVRTPSVPEAQKPNQSASGSLNCCVYPVDLYRRPSYYQELGKRWTMFTEAFGVIVRGQVVHYERVPGGGSRIGRAGLSFVSTISDDESVFNVLYLDSLGRSSELQSLGQLIVVVPARKAQSLDLDRRWVVDIDGMGTLVNTLGSSKPVPRLKFVGYDGQETDLRRQVNDSYSP